MKTEILGSEKRRNIDEKKTLHLDPRTKLLLLLMIAVFVLGGAGGNSLTWARITLATIPMLLILLDGKLRAVMLFSILFAVGCLLQYALLDYSSGILNYMILASAGILTQFLPGLTMGYYVVSTTTVSEFVAAMERMHMPEQITIPLSVMFRFFPTVAEEATDISDAMKMRGISFGGNHPGKILEYRMVPLMTCSVKIGEELSAAALTRGLGAPVRRTNICKIGFKIWDMLLFFFSIVICMCWVMVTVGGIL